MAYHGVTAAAVRTIAAKPDRTAASRFDRRRIPEGAREAVWKAPDGHPIRRIDWPRPPPRGSLLFLPGRADPYEKYLEALEHWHARGWQVGAADWRGQGGSGRFGADPLTGHIDDFARWIDDLAAYWAEWRPKRPGPHVLAAHSMGAHLALRAVAEQRITPDALVLSAPMLSFARRAPTPVLHGVARVVTRFRDPRQPAWKWKEKPGSPSPIRAELLTHDPERYADELWWREHRPELAMGPGSWGWVDAACASMRELSRPGVLERVRIPVLVLATTHDALVGFAAIEKAVRRMPQAELVRFGREARHEILRETEKVRVQALSRIDEFLDRAAPPHPPG